MLQSKQVEIFTWAFWRMSIIIAVLGGIVGALLASIELLTGH